MSKYEFIDSQKAERANLNSVVRMCRWLAVSTSGFYHWATRPQSATAARREALTARIQLERALGEYPNVRQKVLITDDEPKQKAFYESLGYTQTEDFRGGSVTAFVRFD